MAGSDEDRELSGSRPVVLILRLVLDRQAQLHHGELIDGVAMCQGQFRDLRGMQQVLETWLQQQEAALTMRNRTAAERHKAVEDAADGHQ